MDIGTAKVKAEERCRHWIETAASTAFAVAMAFVSISVINAIAKRLPPPIDGGLPQAMALMVPAIGIYYGFCELDSQAADISSIFASLHTIVTHMGERDYPTACMCMMNFVGDLQSETPKEDELTGCCRPYIKRFAASWAPTIAYYYGYR
jgi:hypothetical protein